MPRKKGYKVSEEIKKKIKNSKEKKKGIILELDKAVISADQYQYILTMEGYDEAYFPKLSWALIDYAHNIRKEKFSTGEDKSIDKLLDKLDKLEKWEKKLFGRLDIDYQDAL